MKKLYTTPDYIFWHKRKVERIKNKRRNRKRIPATARRRKKSRIDDGRDSLGLPILAPVDFRLVNNSKECLRFFRDLRNEDNLNLIRNIHFVTMSLQDVEYIDYAAISALTAISDDLKYKGIVLRGNFPKNPDVRRFIEDSGFLNHMVNNKNQSFPKPEKSELIFFEKGQGKLSDADNKKISDVVKSVVNHLTGAIAHFKPVRSILLEICGNSIEWASTDNKQWLLGVKYEPDKVIFTVTDVGRGILGTLHRRFGRQFFDILMKRDDAEILKGAFEKKYSSSSQESNRNKGLPAIKMSSDQGAILNLIVLTNNVILHFNNGTLSRVFDPGSPRFKGTIYQWEMMKECLSKS